MTNKQIEDAFRHIADKINDIGRILAPLQLDHEHQTPILEDYRRSIWTLENKVNFLVDLLIEKGITDQVNLDEKWQQYLKKKVGVADDSGNMDGKMKVTYYGESNG